MDNHSASPYKSGYDLDVYGLQNGTFYSMHIPALICLFTSFVCALLTVILSFKHKSYRTFFSDWSKSERFVVYLAFCDGLYNAFHFVDHLHVTIAQNHVHPPFLCQFYGFILLEFTTSQILMINLVAINAFMLMYFDKNLNFGRRDWRLHLWTFGVPFVCGVVTLGLGQLGPNRLICFFDTVKAKVANTFFTTAPQLIVLLVNIVLYILTFIRLRQQSTRLHKSLQQITASGKATHRAARAMSLFVVAYFVQWWAIPFSGIIHFITGSVPQTMLHINTTFTNIGGVLNLIVFLIIRRKHHFGGTNMTHSPENINQCQITKWRGLETQRTLDTTEDLSKPSDV